MSPEKSEVVWVVVLVQSGIPVSVEVHRDEETARKREDLLREDMRLDYDEVGIFEVKVGTPLADY